MFRARAVPWIVSLVSIPCLLLLVLPGCSSDSAPRSSLVVQSVNDNGVLSSDVYSNGADELYGTEDDNIPEEQIPITLRNDPHDADLGMHTNGPFSSVMLERYEVRYSGGAALPTYGGAMHLIVPSGSTASATIVALPGSYKIAPPLDALVAGGEITLNAEIVLFGVEEDSGDRVTAHANLSINVANWADK